MSPRIRYRGCVSLKKLVFLGVLGLKKLSRPTVLIGLCWFLVILYNAPILKFSQPFFCNFHLEPKLWRHKWRNFHVCESCRRAMRIAPPAVNHRTVATSNLPKIFLWTASLSVNNCLHAKQAAAGLPPSAQAAVRHECWLCCYHIARTARWWRSTSRTGDHWPVSSQYVALWIILPWQNNDCVKSATAMNSREPKSFKYALRFVYKFLLFFCSEITVTCENRLWFHRVEANK